MTRESILAPYDTQIRQWRSEGKSYAAISEILKKENEISVNRHTIKSFCNIRKILKFDKLFHPGAANVSPVGKVERPKEEPKDQRKIVKSSTVSKTPKGITKSEAVRRRIEESKKNDKSGTPTANQIKEMLELEKAEETKRLRGE